MCEPGPKIVHPFKGWATKGPKSIEPHGDGVRGLETEKSLVLNEGCLVVAQSVLFCNGTLWTMK